MDELKEYIKKVGSKWCVFSHQTGRKFGCYDSEAAAKKRLAQIHAFSKEGITIEPIDMLEVKVDVPESGEYIHVRVKDPSQFDQESFRTITLGDGIKARAGKLHGSDKMTIQVYLFDKDKWTVGRAKQWVKEH